MRRLLFPFELHSRGDLLEARGGVEPRACPPSSRRFGLEDRCRVRGPMNLGDGEIRTHNLLFTKQPLYQLELHRHMWPGREANAPLRTPRSRQSPFCRDESRPHNFGAQGRTQTFNLWFVGPALHQLSYSGEKLVVGVGIEPTFRVFQTRANPSQLSDRLERAVRLELTILDLQSSALATWRRAQ